jgi:F0F1-type ATP synthase membrane subunit c/vacuolar-type H+-ATPase subunit K
MKAIVEISKRGTGVVANAMITISKYLKDTHKVQENLKEIMGETTSTMEIQAFLLAPLASGIVVALAAMIMQMLLHLRESLESLQSQLFSGGPVGATGGGVLSSVMNLNQIIPAHFFQLIVGVYMIEIVGILAIFLSAMNNGEESLLRKFNLGKTLGLATVVYSITLIGVYLMFQSIIPVAGVFE